MTDAAMNDDCAHAEPPGCGAAARRRAPRRRPPGLLADAGAQRRGRDRKAGYGYVVRLADAGDRFAALGPRRLVERAGAVRPALVGGAGRRPPPLRPAEDRDPGGARHRRADRRRPVRVRRRAAVHALHRPPPGAPRRRWAASRSCWRRWPSTLFVTRYEHRKATRARQRAAAAPTPATPSPTSTRRGRWSPRSSPSGPASPGRTAWRRCCSSRLIGHAAWEVFRDNVPVLIDAAMLDPASVAELAGSLAARRLVHRVRSRGVRRAVELDLHLEVAPEMSVAEAHGLARQIERGSEGKVSGGFRRNHPHRTETRNRRCTNDDEHLETQPELGLRRLDTPGHTDKIPAALN